MREMATIFSHPNPPSLIFVAAKTAVVYFFLVAGLRLLGKRELGQMNIYDLVLLIVIANSVQNAMVGDDTTLPGGLVSATTLLILNRLLSLLLSRSRKLSHLLVGEAVLLVNNGHALKDRIEHEGITHEQLMTALREHGLVSLEQVRMAVLEVDGTISVVPEDSKVFRTRRHYRALRLP